jgi:diketogulonate reductase-like aldo/keto reductase
VSVLTDTYTLNNGDRIPKIGFGTWLSIPWNRGGFRYAAWASRAGAVDRSYSVGERPSQTEWRRRWL